jgi:hypothetical protein
MLELIIDKNFLENFFILTNDSDYHRDVEKFLKKVKNFTLITNYTSIEEMQSDVLRDENYLLEELISRVPTLKFIPELSQEIQQEAYYKDSSAFKLFFVENLDEVACTELSQKYGFSYLNTSNLQENWEAFYSEREDRAQPITQDILSNPRFDTWEKVKYFQHPVHSILIFDLYLFCNDPRVGLIEDNLLVLFKSLLYDTSLMKPLEVTIITDDRQIKPENVQIENRMKVITKELKLFFKENFSNLKVEITIIKYDKRRHTEGVEVERDRGIYTNNFFIRPNHGINILDEQQKIYARSDIQFYWLFRPMEYNLSVSGLRNFKKYIEDLESYLSTRQHQRVKYFYNYSNIRLLDSL